jgi:hypothetical protein
MIPPGYPDFHTRERIAALKPCRIEGRAWSGFGRIVGVEVTADGGAVWEEAEVADDAPSRWAWQSWSYVWEPQTSGRYELACRARDEAGNDQPDEALWNLGGYANNAVQRVPVTVVP